jgi:hypothetical protein
MIMDSKCFHVTHILAWIMHWQHWYKKGFLERWWTPNIDMYAKLFIDLDNLNVDFQNIKFYNIKLRWTKFFQWHFEVKASLGGTTRNHFAKIKGKFGPN